MYKERFTGLLEKIHETQSDPGMFYNAVKTSMAKFAEYVNAVYSMEVGINVARFRCNSVEDYQDIVRTYDTSRRQSHEAAIAGVSMMNRICDMVGAERIYQGTDDRIEIGDFCGQIVNEFFEGRERGRTISTQEMDEKVDQEIEEIERG